MKKIGYGIVGLNFGGYHARSLVVPPASDHVELLAVCDIQRERADHIAGKYGVKAYYDLADMLADDRIEAVGVYTNPYRRADVVGQVVRAGRHTMVTKPFELDPAAAADVLAEARRLKRVVHLNSPPPLLAGSVGQAVAWQKEFQLGRPVGCRFDLWTNKRDKPDGGWLDDPARCPAAPITRVGIYLINDLVRLMGPAEAVHVMHSRIFTGRPTPDNAQLSIVYRNKALANLFVSFCIDDGQEFKESMVLNYQNGTMYYRLGCMSDLPPVNFELVGKDPAGQPIRQRAMLKTPSHEYQWDAFHRAVAGEDIGPCVSDEEIVEGVKVLAAMARSDKSGQTETV